MTEVNSEKKIMDRIKQPIFIPIKNMVFTRKIENFSTHLLALGDEMKSR